MMGTDVGGAGGGGGGGCHNNGTMGCMVVFAGGSPRPMASGGGGAGAGDSGAGAGYCGVGDAGTTGDAGSTCACQGTYDSQPSSPGYGPPPPPPPPPSNSGISGQSNPNSGQPGNPPGWCAFSWRSVVGSTIVLTTIVSSIIWTLKGDPEEATAETLHSSMPLPHGVSPTARTRMLRPPMDRGEALLRAVATDRPRDRARELSSLVARRGDLGSEEMSRTAARDAGGDAQEQRGHALSAASGTLREAVPVRFRDMPFPPRRKP